MQLNFYLKNSRLRNLISEDKDTLKDLAIIFIASRMVMLFIMWYTRYVLNLTYPLGTILLNYDGEHYYNIAINGYTQNYQYAFFPLFPLVIRFISLFYDPILGSVILNHILSFSITILIYYIGKDIMEQDTQTSKMMSKFWIFSPITICTGILYTEPLFLFLTLSSYLLFKKEKYEYAGIVLGLSVATRNTGSMLFFALFISMVIKLYYNKDIKIAISILRMFIPATLFSLIYPLYLIIKVGNWHYFIDVQFLYWGRAKSNFIITVINDMKKFTTNPISVIVTYVSLSIFIYIVIKSIVEKLNFELLLYVILSMISIYSTQRVSTANISSTSFYRYFYSIMPIYILINPKTNMKLIFRVNMALSIIIIYIYSINGFLI